MCSEDFFSCLYPSHGEGCGWISDGREGFNRYDSHLANPCLLLFPEEGIAQSQALFIIFQTPMVLSPTTG
jgi:hypothetical protein